MLSIPLLNTAYDTVHNPRKTIIGTLHPIEIKDIEVSNIFWTKKLQQNKSPAEFLSVLSQLSFQPEQNDLKPSVILQDAQIPEN